MTKTLTTLLATAALGLAAPALAQDAMQDADTMNAHGHVKHNTDSASAVSGSFLKTEDDTMMAEPVMADTTVQTRAVTTIPSTTVLNTSTVMVDSDFDGYDADRDGRIVYNEYYKMARKDGLSATAAAQRFVKMTNGQAYLDRDTFTTAMSYGPDYYDGYVVRSTPNTAVLNTTTVNSVPSVTTDGLMMDDTVRATTTTTTDFDTTGTYSTGSMPRATTEPLYRPEDKVLGDLTTTPSTTIQTQDYPSSYDGTADVDSTIVID